MMKLRTATKQRCRSLVIGAVAVTAALLGAVQVAQAQRVLGLDVSYWQGHISQTTWNNIYNVENREFVFIRSSRGGTTGVDQPQGTPGGGSQSTLSRRYDDPRFVQNISRATQAGLVAGTYHFSRPDIVTNTGTDEANHFMEMAGPWMRPGYLLPVHDFEAGDGARSDNDMAQFAIDFSNRINDVMGIRPAIYVNGNYANFVLGGASSSLRAQVNAAYPTLWIARWPNQGNPNAIDVQNSQPDDSLEWLYGLFDDYGESQPWEFWQYASTGRLQSFNNGGSNLDFNVSQGDIEYVKDHLVPALWMNNSSGDWSALANWNSGQTPIQPPVVPGQATPYATSPLPTPRAPGVDDAVNNIDGENDTVILDRPSANITVTISTGTYDIRKLFMRETLNITGGSLNIHYDPNYTTAPGTPLALRSGPVSAQFSGAVTLSGSGALSVHTLQVDSTRTFTLGGGTLTFDTLNLMPHSSSPAKIAVTGNININPLDDATATIARGAGSGSTGSVDLNGGDRTLTVGNGSAAVDVSIDVPVTNGTLTKSGLGTMVLNAANTHSQTNVNDGVLLVTANNQLGSGSVFTNMTVETPGSGGAGHGGTLRLSNNVNYNQILVIGGAGLNGASLSAPGSTGALDNASGNNTWSGAIFLAGTGSGGTDPLMNQISAQSGALQLSGVIQDAVGVNATLAKTGDADVILTGSQPNTYTGLTRVSGGRLIVEKDGALGAAGSSTSAAGNTFQLAGSASTIAFQAPSSSSGFTYSTSEVINTHGSGAPGLGQIDNLSGNNTFAGQIALDGPEVGGIRQSSIGVSSGSLHVTGGLFARGSDGSPRHITKVGSGTLILSGDGGAATGNSLVAPLSNSSFSINSGAVFLNGPSATSTNLPGVTVWNVNSGGTLIAASGLFSTNSVNVGAGGQFQLSGGTATINTLGLLGGGTVNVIGGSLHVNTVQGSLTNQGGAISPGNSIGITFITGDYVQQSGGLLDIQIGGAPNTGQNDVVAVSGVATLDGTIDVSLINDFTPTAGQLYTVLGASSLVNNGLTLSGAAASLFNLIVDGTSVMLETIGVNLPGDFNNDGSVDAADYVVWRKNGGSSQEYQDWRANFGQQSSGGGTAASQSFAAVPEPGSIALLAIAGAMFLGVCGRRRP